MSRKPALDQTADNGHTPAMAHDPAAPPRPTKEGSPDPVTDATGAGAEPPAGADEGATRAGRGVLLMTGSKLYFIVAGYSVQLLLPRLLGTPEAFGLYSSAMSLVSILNNVLIVATMQTVSRRVSEDRGSAPLRLREGLVLQLSLGLLLGGGLLLTAGRLSREVLLDPLLSPLFRVAAIVVLSYAVYAVTIGYLNGRQQFQHQAVFDLGYTTMRTTGILGAAALGFGALGAVAGFASAAALVVVIALFVVGTGAASAAASTGAGAQLRRWLSLLAPLWLYHLCLNMTLQVDLTVLKRNVAALGLTVGQLSPDAAAALASRYAGFYRAAQTFSFVPYQLIMSVALVVFPMIAEATTLGDALSTRRYIAGALRFSLIVLLAVAAPVAGAAQGVMLIAYPADYLAGADALSVLSLGMAAFALFVIAATIMSGAGRPGVSATVACLGVVTVVLCNTAFVRHVGVGERTLMAAASGTTAGTVLSLLAMGTLVYLRFGTFLPWATVARVALSAVAAFLAARHLPHADRLSAIGALIGGGVAYLVSLGVLGELGKADVARIRKVLGR